MAKTKPAKTKKESKKRQANPSLNKGLEIRSPAFLLESASQSLQLGNVEAALPVAKQALDLLQAGATESLPALNLLGQIYIELGDIELARQYFQKAVTIDKEGTVCDEDGGGAEKFLWLAQLSEEGGNDSVSWFEKAATILRRQIQNLLSHKPHITEEHQALLTEKTRKLAGALCSLVEVYMTDLSWEEDAESICETLITEATMVAPDFAEPWQTLANVRISQNRMADAQAALKRSLDLWKGLPLQDPNVPEFSTRVSLARLLLEADMDEEAIDVLEFLISENDSSVEAWYLGGWGLYIMGEKQKSQIEDDKSHRETWQRSWMFSRQWLNQALHLFDQQNYEDERLGEHTRELLKTLNAELGTECKIDDKIEGLEDNEWSDVEESDKDEPMACI